MFIRNFSSFLHNLFTCLDRSIYTKRKKSDFHSCNQLGNPLGIILGFGISTLIKPNKWYISYSIETTFLIILAFLSLFFPRLYYTKKLILNDDGLSAKLIYSNNEENPSLCNNLGKILCNVIFTFTTISFVLLLFWNVSYSILGSRIYKKCIEFIKSTQCFI